MTTRKRPEKLGARQRSFQIRADKSSLDTEKRTLSLSFSSEAPVEDWFGTEILSHAQGSIRMAGDRQKNMPLLFNHVRGDLLGVVEGISVADGKGVANVRFGKDDRGTWAMNQVADGILRNSSFLYRVYAYEADDDEDDDAPTYRATDWEPFEISLVTVPADASVGVGRAADDAAENTVALTIRKREAPASTGVTTVSKETTPTPEAAPTGGAQVVVDIDKVRREERDRERGRMQAISALALSHGLGHEFVSKHHDSTVEQAQTAVLTELAHQRADSEGIAQRERERIREIEELGKKAKIPQDKIREAVDKKVPVEAFRGVVLAGMLDRGDSITPLGAAPVDLSNKEKNRYSLRAAILAAASSDWKNAGFEREVSDTIEKERSGKGLVRHGGSSFYMPTNLPFQVPGAQRSAYITDSMVRDMRERTAYNVGTASQGGNIVGTELLAADFIEVLRNSTVTGQLGARYLTGLVENINIPRQNAQTATYWVGESVALTESEATFDQVTMRPHVIGALSKMSRLMLQQSTPAIEMLVREDLLMVEALGVDLAALIGSGSSSQPTGISNTTGIGSVVGGTNGANLTFDMLIQLYAAPLVANAPQANLGFAMNAKAKGYLATLKATTGQYLWAPQGNVGNAIQDQIVGYKYAVSNQLPFNLTKGSASAICSELMFGNWQELLIGEWGVTEIMVNPYDSTGFTTGDVLVRVFQTMDVGLRHPASFAVMSDALTPGF